MVLIVLLDAFGGTQVVFKGASRHPCDDDDELKVGGGRVMG